MGDEALNARVARWYSCSQCEQWYHGVVACALGWACWKTYLGRPETDAARRNAMTQLGNGLSQADLHADALSVQVAELSTLRRLGAQEEIILPVQSNLAVTYFVLRRDEQALSMRRDVYFGSVRLFGDESEETFVAVENYALSLLTVRRFEEAKRLLRKTMPVARRVLGENDRLTLKLRWSHARALYEDASATLGDLREAVAMIEDVVRIARRVLGGQHPLLAQIERSLRIARAALRARESPPRGSA